MKKYLLTITAIAAFSAIASAQTTNRVGINTTSPAATLDVVGKPADANALDGVIAPRLSGDQLADKTYTAAQTGAIVYATAADGTPAGQTVNVTAAGYYYFDGAVWVAMGGGSSTASTQRYENIRGNVYYTTTTNYTVAATDYLVVNTMPSATITLPNLTTDAADSGRVVTLFNKSSDASSMGVTGVGGSYIIGGNSYNRPLGNNISLTGLRGATYMWIGDVWVSIGK